MGSERNVIVRQNLAFTEGDDFAVEILRGLLKDGLTGDILLSEFVAQREKIKTAWCKLLQEADEIARGERPYATMADVFGKRRCTKSDSLRRQSVLEKIT